MYTQNDNAFLKYTVPVRRQRQQTHHLSLKRLHTHHVYITSGDITLTYIHFLETYPNLNQHMPNPNPYPNQVFTLKLMIPLMGPPLCPHKGGESPHVAV